MNYLLDLMPMFQMKPGQTCSQKKWLKHIRLVAVGLLSFYFGGSKLVRSLAKTEHTKRKLLNFVMPSHQEVGINLEGKMPENGSY